MKYFDIGFKQKRKRCTTEKDYNLYLHLKNNDTLSLDEFHKIGFIDIVNKVNKINMKGAFYLQEYKPNHYAIFKL